MIIAADNLTGADPVVAQALRHLDPAPLQDLARRCEAAGAQILDLTVTSPAVWRTAWPSWWKPCRR